MRNKQRVFNGISVFYAQKKFHKLISGFIVPYFEKLLKDKCIVGYYLHLSHEQGSHINVSYFLNETSGKIAREIEYNASGFLKSAPSKTSKEVFPKETIFRNFENNTFYHGIFKPYPVSTQFLKESELLRIRKALTILIGAELANRQFGKEELFSFCVHLQMVMAKAIFITKSKARSVMIRQVDRMLVTISTTQQQLVRRAADQVLQSNFAALVALSQAIWLPNGTDRSNDSYQCWDKACKNLGNNLSNGEMVYMDICGILMEHIDFPNRQLFFTSVITATKMLF